MTDSPEEPDKMEITPYSKPLIIPLEDMSGDTAIIYDYTNIPWPKSKGEQFSPTVEFPIRTNDVMSIGNIMAQQPQFQM